jgi:hypothetical protein
VPAMLFYCAPWSGFLERRWTALLFLLAAGSRGKATTGEYYG